MPEVRFMKPNHKPWVEIERTLKEEYIQCSPSTQCEDTRAVLSVPDKRHYIPLDKDERRRLEEGTWHLVEEGATGNQPHKFKNSSYGRLSDPQE